MSTGTVAEIRRFPVKSMGGERLPAARFGPAGVLGDRAFAVVDVEDGSVASAKHLQRWPGLMDFSARYSAEPEPGRVLPPAWVRFPDGSVLRSDDENVHAALSGVFGREVVLRAGEEPFVDLAAAHVLTSTSLTSVGGLVGETVDVRRFRPTLLLDAPGETGYPEDAWVDRPLSVGDDVGLRAFMPAPRCVMTTLAQPELPADARLLAALTREHRRTAGEYGGRPCLGVYADVTGEGTVSEGDTWRLA